MLSPLENRNKNSSCCNTVGKFTLSFSHTKYGQSYNLHKNELLFFKSDHFLCGKKWLTTYKIIFKIINRHYYSGWCAASASRFEINYWISNFWFLVYTKYLHTFYDIRNAPLCSASILSLRSKQKFSRLQTF